MADKGETFWVLADAKKNIWRQVKTREEMEEYPVNEIRYHRSIPYSALEKLCRDG